jgi:hypothetical protein
LHSKNVLLCREWSVVTIEPLDNAPLCMWPVKYEYVPM